MLLKLFYFIISYYCLSIIVPIHKLNFIILMYRTEHSIYRVWYYTQFQASTEGLGTYLPRIRETTVFLLRFVIIWGEEGK